MWSSYTEFQTNTMLMLGTFAIIMALLPFLACIWKVLFLVRTHHYRMKAKAKRDMQYNEANTMMDELTKEMGVPSYLQMKADRKGKKKVDQKFKLGEQQSDSDSDEGDAAKKAGQAAASGTLFVCFTFDFSSFYFCICVSGLKALGGAMSVFKKHKMSGKAKTKRQVFGMDA